MCLSSFGESSDTFHGEIIFGEPHVDVVAVVEGLPSRISLGIAPEEVDVSLSALNSDVMMEDAGWLEETQGRFQEVLNNLKELRSRIAFFIDE